MEKLIITAAISGAEVTKEHNPAVPYTIEDCVREVSLAYEAGASIIHLHVRRDDGTPTQDKNRFKEVKESNKKLLNKLAINILYAISSNILAYIVGVILKFALIN